jgi:hypothetical protein
MVGSQPALRMAPRLPQTLYRPRFKVGQPQIIRPPIADASLTLWLRLESAQYTIRSRTPVFVVRPSVHGRLLTKQSACWERPLSFPRPQGCIRADGQLFPQARRLIEAKQALAGPHRPA